MAIHFTEEQWQNVKTNYDLWWEGKLDRPLIRLVMGNSYDPGRERPETPFTTQANCNDFSYTPEQIIDTIDYELSKCEFLGDSFPYMNFSYFGPGVLAAFCGAQLVVNNTGNVWFFPEREMEISEIHIKYNPESVYARRIKDIYRAGIKKWNGQVVMGMPDLGGVMDVVATFRGTENLLYDLYDEPEEVLRVIHEVEIAWKEAYEDFNRVLQPVNPGYSDWSLMFSTKPSYIIQCDFCYMLGNDMFRQFVLDSLKKHCKDMHNVIYHLDGIGELKHLDDLLQMPDLKAVQWVPGAGQVLGMPWIDVYRRIAAANKGIYLACDNSDALKIKKELKKGFFFGASFPQEQREDALAFLKAMYAKD